jgi:mannose-1-phosphate guanylyltransferase
MIPALILSAGVGSRLDPITRLVAKPAVPLGRSTLIEHVLTWLYEQGVRDCVINLHHRPETIARVVGDGSHIGLSVRYSWEHPLLGSAGGPKKALPLLETDTFLIVNGDTLRDFDLAAMMAEHEASRADVTLAVIPNPAPDHYNGIVADSDGRVTGFVPRGPGAAGSWHLIGVQIVRRPVFEPLELGMPAETVAGIYRERLVTHPGSIRVFRSKASFHDIGTSLDYLHTELALSGHHRADHTGSTIVDSVIWPEVTIGPGVSLERCIVAGHLSVPAGLRASASVIVPASVYRESDVSAHVHDGVAIFPLDRAVHSIGA